MSKKSTPGDGSHGKGQKGICSGPRSRPTTRVGILQVLRGLAGLIRS